VRDWLDLSNIGVGKPHTVNREFGARSRGQAAERMQRHRTRERNGQIVLRLTINEADITAALTLSGALASADADDRHRVEAAVQTLLGDWAAAWRERG
jgi:hypothetical protein